MSERVYTAAVLIIGNEILSGRTQDVNLAFLGKALNTAGIRLREARVVADVPEEIVSAVNALRARFDYLFTTGGIGPTHDDITSQCIAQAFGVPLILHPEAHAILAAHYKADDLTQARLRMAHTPQGARLIENPVSKAPGYRIGNVFVMAGVPAIMRAMFDSLRPQLVGGKPLISRTMMAFVAEGVVAKPLGDLQLKFPAVDMGSYPFNKEGRFGTRLVFRASDKAQLDTAFALIEETLAALDVERQEES